MRFRQPTESLVLSAVLASVGIASSPGCAVRPPVSCTRPTPENPAPRVDEEELRAAAKAGDLSQVKVSMNRPGGCGQILWSNVVVRASSLLQLPYGRSPFQAAPQDLATPRPGVWINSANATHYTALHLAAEGGHVQVVRFLLAQGANPSLKTDDGFLPLHFAAMTKDGATVKAIIQSVNSGDLVLRSIGLLEMDQWGQTPLHLAAVAGNDEAIGLLLQAGAYPNAVDADGETPLFKAAHWGKATSAALLIKAGADVNLARKPAAGNPSPSGDTPLVRAVRQEQTEVVRILVSTSVKVNQPGEDGQTALELAAGKNKLDQMTMLLLAGADVNLADSAGNTPLHRAASRGRAEAVGLLIDREAKLDAINNRYLTPLLLAAEAGEAAICERLIAAGASLQIVDAAGNTALHLAIASEDPRTVQVLVQHGIGSNIKNKAGKTASDLAETDRLKEALSRPMD